LNLAIAAAVFPVIFIGELPDKTMFASLLLASRGHARAVWFGAAAAFTIHVAIAVTIGVALFHIIPHRLLEALIAAMFIVGGVLALVEANKDETELVAREAASHRRVFTTAFGVIFIAEWGDLTQVLTANLAAHYHSAISVAVGATLALWAVAGLAVVGGKGLLRYLPVVVVRRVTAGVLFALAAVAIYAAVHG
jgi:putative Ca2+/H+ antiporter (TMEM165/GDT1 family)